MQKKHPHILQQRCAALLIVDMQEKFEKVIPDFSSVEAKILTLIEGCKVLGLPIFFTEQYPKGLGRTTSKIRRQLEGLSPIEKLRFSAAETQLVDSLHGNKVKQLILVGIEAHVCVLQSALDFIELGFQAHVVGDAVASRHAENRDFAIERMRQHGVNVTVVESVLFELLEMSDSDQFRKISKLLK